MQKSGSYAKKRKKRTFSCAFGAGSRGRTDTVLLPSDFESDASANSTIPAMVAAFIATPSIIA